MDIVLQLLAMEQMDKPKELAVFICFASASSMRHMPVFSTIVCMFLILSFYILLRRRISVYLLDFVCFTPNPSSRCPAAAFMEHSTLMGFFNEASLQFQKLILERSGVGDMSSLPTGLTYLPPQMTIADARQESESSIFSTVETLLSETSIAAHEIDIVVANCSCFTPVPSLSEMIMNKFKLRSDVRIYNLSGMGCSASAISLNLAQSLMRVYPNSYAMVVSAENITQNYYCGNRRSMMIPNCLFRVGAAAILLSNKPCDARRSKYRLERIVRTTTGADDRSYSCVYQQEDEEGHVGVSLSRDLVKVAGDALKFNITTVAPLVLPLKEQLFYVISEVLRLIQSNPKSRPYVPDFKKAVDHICVHAGGRSIIDEIERSLRLQPEHMEASRMTLHKFGNTSSSSIWYELAYLEAKGRIKPAQLVWQIAFGSGFKCNSLIWRAMPSISELCMKGNCKNPWKDYVHQYPITISQIRQ
ncbi:hypothetical protein KP509_39G044200 [Ceratopteris richardii]|uniref:3-ketoacyl-CoA synthase n=1 Tax=Ceratopteris richardii TaxID=49495 RepID=A0A8T2Q0L6_CERRI|nr:hypothetical protein KP509_39G044200 [Ceratopteris richardii]